MPITPNETNISKHIMRAMTFGKHECVVKGDAVLISAEYGELSDRVPVTMEITINNMDVAFNLTAGSFTIEMRSGANDLRVSIRDEDNCELGFMPVPVACILHTELITVQSDGLPTNISNFPKIDEWPEFIS